MIGGRCFWDEYAIKGLEKTWVGQWDWLAAYKQGVSACFGNDA